MFKNWVFLSCLVIFLGFVYFFQTPKVYAVSCSLDSYSYTPSPLQTSNDSVTFTFKSVDPQGNSSTKRYWIGADCRGQDQITGKGCNGTGTGRLWGQGVACSPNLTPNADGSVSFTFNKSTDEYRCIFELGTRSVKIFHAGQSESWSSPDICSSSYETKSSCNFTFPQALETVVPNNISGTNIPNEARSMVFMREGRKNPDSQYSIDLDPPFMLPEDKWVPIDVSNNQFNVNNVNFSFPGRYRVAILNKPWGQGYGVQYPLCDKHYIQVSSSCTLYLTNPFLIANQTQAEIKGISIPNYITVIYFENTANPSDLVAIPVSVTQNNTFTANYVFPNAGTYQSQIRVSDYVGVERRYPCKIPGGNGIITVNPPGVPTTAITPIPSPAQAPDYTGTTQPPELTDLCRQSPGDSSNLLTQKGLCYHCLLITKGIWTGLGCIKVDISGFTSSFFTIGLSLAGGIALLFLIYGGFLILTSGGNPETIQQGKEILTSAIAGLLLIIFSVFILRLVAVDILKIPGFG